ncbi:triose-phosphate isomerase [Marinicella sp. W31]|uniref:triose-phosphate isomerase n=1 Tax=Marinicella sp. W31 TaxID=3023713 RepID=UPI0037572C4B
MSRKILVAGNWKMHGDADMVKTLLGGIKAGVADDAPYEVAVCPPDVFLSQAQAMISDSPVRLGGQTVSEHPHGGAHTGETSAEMLLSMGCELVLVGHSERRTDNAETDADVAHKFARAQAAGLLPVLCIGETLEERKAGSTMAVVKRQIEAVIEVVGIKGFEQSVIAYEPVWAIGTGLTASPEEAQEVHQFIRSQLAEKNDTIARRIQILYGGSCKGSNANALFSMPDIDGGLIGGAALTSTDFLAICEQAAIVSAQTPAGE